MSNASSTSSGNTQGIAFKVSQFRETFKSKLADDLFCDKELDLTTPNIRY